LDNTVPHTPHPIASSTEPKIPWWRNWWRYHLVFDTITIRLLFLLWIVLLVPMTALLMVASQLISQTLHTSLAQQANDTKAQVNTTLHLSQVLLSSLTRDDLALSGLPPSSLRPEWLANHQCKGQPVLKCVVVSSRSGSKPPQPGLPNLTGSWLVQQQSQALLKGISFAPFYQVDPTTQSLLLWEPMVPRTAGAALTGARGGGGGEVLIVGRPLLPLLESTLQALPLPKGSHLIIETPDQRRLLHLTYPFTPNPAKKTSQSTPDEPLNPANPSISDLKHRYLVDTLVFNDEQGLPVATLTLALPGEWARQAMQSFLVGSYSIFIIGMICSMALAFGASRTVIKPLYTVLEQMDAASNSLLILRQEPQPMVVAGVYEVKRLASGFTRLFSSLSQEYRLRDEFVATLTHDLKVPLLAQRQTLEYFSREVFGPITETQATVLQAMRHSNHEVLRLVNSLLEVYRYDSSAVVLRQTQTGLASLVGQVLPLLQPLIEEKGIQLHLDLNETAQAYVDELEVKRVIQNLLANAIQYTPQSGKLTVALFDGDLLPSDTLQRVTSFELSTLTTPVNVRGKVLLSIQDGGIGFDRATLDTVFQRFASQRSHHPLSLGLGLYHSYQVTTAHGGHIWIETTEGQGSAVNLLLPASAAAWQEGDLYHDRRNRPVG
jgi:signal transduction histidine kinase